MNILIIGGNRFFGKKLVNHLLVNGHEVTLLNRGNIEDGFGDRVKRLKCNRRDRKAMADVLTGRFFDVVYDQVCYDFQSAKQACELFEGKVERYILTSTQSVYNSGSNLKESQFQPEKYKATKEETKESDYAEAKRQVEVGFFENAQFSTSFVRIPIVLGEDDYTGRFRFHVDRIKREQPIFFPNQEAQISFITSDFAAQAFAAFAERPVSGSINVASPEPIRLRDFVETIESAVGKKIVLTENSGDEFHSPYGIKSDWYMNCDRLKELGIEGPLIRDWLPELVKSVNQ